jgi:4-hydroxybutyrate CoA-transferase
MDWRREYKRKKCSADQAVRAVESGDRVVIQHACGEPQHLVAALMARGGELNDVEIVHMMAMGKAEYCNPEWSGHFYHNALFAGPGSRAAIAAGNACHTPCHFSEIPDLFLEGYLPVDVALIHLSPPDQHGYCSFGVSVDYSKPAASVARTVIAQINPRMPRTHGDSYIHLSTLDYIVEHEEPLIEIPSVTPGPVEEAIGRNIADLVKDGDCLQLGLGGIPDAVLHSLGDKNDLGIHTELFGDTVVDLVDAGVITGTRKNLHREKLVANCLVGTHKVFDFANDNPLLNMYPVSYTNDPFVISQIDNMVAINSAIEVDLMGQVVADTMGARQFSGVGGQIDFVRGATRSKGGRAIIALPSTARGGAVSRIVATISEGATVTTTRADVDYVVTEHGVAHLKGKSLPERALAMLEIAHPDFRDQIVEEGQRLKGPAMFQTRRARHATHDQHLPAYPIAP